MAVKDQLYAEAVALEPTEKLYLDTDELKAAHDVIVSGAKEDNELVDVLLDLKGEIWDLGGNKCEERVSTAEVRSMLGMFPSDALRSHGAGRRIAEAMMALNWTKAPATIRCHKGAQPTTGYTRPLPVGAASNGATGATGPTGEKGTAGASSNTGRGPTGPAGYSSRAHETGGTTFDQMFSQGMARAQADLEFVRRNS